MDHDRVHTELLGLLRLLDDAAVLVHVREVHVDLHALVPGVLEDRLDDVRRVMACDDDGVSAELPDGTDGLELLDVLEVGHDLEGFFPLRKEPLKTAEDVPRPEGLKGVVVHLEDAGTSLPKLVS